ncbi:hypothetical protein HAX54_037140 [Datura stramonium]|uniref:Uncharacterized protein n=1 Tax=Datura stramonium TaxID=4076 RepID=A0ABS8SGP9_DATST|nr:hypothetical protein [Datura stramonium]
MEEPAPAIVILDENSNESGGKLVLADSRSLEPPFLSRRDFGLGYSLSLRTETRGIDWWMMDNVSTKCLLNNCAYAMYKEALALVRDQSSLAETLAHKASKLEMLNTDGEVVVWDPNEGKVKTVDETKGKSGIEFFTQPLLSLEASGSDISFIDKMRSSGLPDD